MKFAPLCENEGANFALFIAEKSAKISASGQTCGQRRKMGLFNPRSREGQVRFICCENARFQEIKRENKRKSEVRLNLRFWSNPFALSRTPCFFLIFLLLCNRNFALIGAKKSVNFVILGGENASFFVVFKSVKNA